MEDFDEILQKIGQVPHNATHIQEWLLSLTTHKESEIRMRALEKLGQLMHDKVLPAEVCIRLREALSDEDELVRCVSLEILGDHTYCVSTGILVDLLRDQSGLVRGEAAKLLGNCGAKNADSAILQALENADEVEQAPIYFALYRLQNPAGLAGLLKLLKSSNYLARCAAANLLCFCDTAANRDVVLTALTSALIEEPTVAARSSINGAIAGIVEGMRVGRDT